MSRFEAETTSLKHSEDVTELLCSYNAKLKETELERERLVVRLHKLEMERMEERKQLTHDKQKLELGNQEMEYRNQLLENKCHQLQQTNQQLKQTSKEEKQLLEQKNQRLEDERQQLKTAIAAKEDKIRVLTDRIDNLEKERNALHHRQTTLEREFKKLQADNNRLRQDVDIRQRTVDEKDQVRAERDCQTKLRLEKLEQRQQQLQEANTKQSLMFEQLKISSSLQLARAYETQQQYQQPYQPSTPLPPASVQRHNQQVSCPAYANTSSQAPQPTPTTKNGIDSTDSTDSEGVPGFTNLHITFDRERTHLELSVPSTPGQVYGQEKSWSHVSGDNAHSHGNAPSSVPGATRTCNLIHRGIYESMEQKPRGGMRQGQSLPGEFSLGTESRQAGRYQDGDRRQPRVSSFSEAHGLGSAVTPPPIPVEESLVEHQHATGLHPPFKAGCHSKQATQPYGSGHGVADLSPSFDCTQRQVELNCSTVPNRRRPSAEMLPDSQRHQGMRQDNYLGNNAASSHSSSIYRSASAHEHANTDSTEQCDKVIQSTPGSDKSSASLRTDYLTADELSQSDNESQAALSQIQSSMPSPPSMDYSSITASGYGDGQVTRGGSYLFCQVKDIHIDAVKKKVGKQWLTVGRHLPEFTIDEAEDAVSRYDSSFPSYGDRFYHTVKAWVKKIGSRATVGQLVAALEKAQLKDVAETLMEIVD